MIEYIGKCLLIEEEKENILVVGDLHLGYERGLNGLGTNVGERMFSEMIKEFDYLLKKTGKLDKIILLGDVKHDFSENTKEEWGGALKLFDYLLKKCKEVIITRGNHDNYLKTIAGKRKIEVRDYYIWKDYCFLHGNKDYFEIDDKKTKYLIMGHGHPAINISDGIKNEKYKCFLSGKYKGKEIIILPSFSEYNEGSDPREYDLGFPWKFDLNKFEVRVVGEKEKIFNFGKLEKIS